VDRINQTLLGPGLIYYTAPRPPSLYLEGGIGYSSVQSISRELYVMGAGLFAGVGVEITPQRMDAV